MEQPQGLWVPFSREFGVLSHMEREVGAQVNMVLSLRGLLTAGEKEVRKGESDGACGSTCR